MKQGIDMPPGELAIVEYSFENQERHAEGIIEPDTYYPWNLILSTNTGHLTLDFLGAQVGISQIGNREGELIYLNEYLPTPYKHFHRDDSKEAKELNDLRRETFGKGFDYVSYF